MAIVDPVRPASRRLDTAGPGTADVVGLRLTLGALLRWSPIVLLAALLGWLVGGALPELGRSTSANVSLGLTDHVRWPFYDAVMARQPALLDTDEVRAATEADVGATADSVTLDLGTGQTGAVMRIVVEAEREEHALALAQGMGERLVAANLAEQRVVVEERIARLEADVDERRTELATLDARRDEERLALDSDAAEITQAQLLVVAAHLTEAEAQLESAQEELADLGPRVAIVAPAVAGREPGDATRSSAVTAALLALLAVGVVPSLDRRFGRVRTVAQLRRIWPAVPAVDERRGSALLGEDLPTVVDGLAAMHGSVVVVAGDEQTADRLLGRPNSTVVVLGHVGLAASLADADAVVIAVRRRSVALRRLDETADGLAGLGVRPTAVVLTS